MKGRTDRTRETNAQTTEIQKQTIDKQKAGRETER